jgi:hypothetical protein
MESRPKTQDLIAKLKQDLTDLRKKNIFELPKHLKSIAIKLPKKKKRRFNANKQYNKSLSI